MKIYASLQMDISYYLKWLKNRLEQGFFDKEKDLKTIERYYFNNIEELILYTRYPSKIYKEKEFFENYNTTLITFFNMYDSFYEPKIKDKQKSLNAVRKCKNYFNNYFGYGPVFFTPNHDKEWHLKQFRFLCESLNHFVQGCYISFNTNTYCTKSKKFNVQNLTEEEQQDILLEFKNIANEYNINVDKMILLSEINENDIDIGLHNCCPNACEYCSYINNGKAACDKYKIFDDKNTLLYGIISNNQKIKTINNSIKENIKNTFDQKSIFDFL